MNDYRYDMLAYGLRKESNSYPMSRQATEDLKANQPMEDSSEKLWDDIWKELHAEYELTQDAEEQQ